MNALLTLDGLSAPLRSLRLLAADFPDLPGPVVDVSTIYPDRLSLSWHTGQGGFASFEAWRAALGIHPATIDFHVQCDGRTGVMQAQTFYGGAHIALTGYTQVAPGDAA
ncbi:hypothetical protein ACFV3N_22030 [Streptomyces bauhiniae]|uniref:hypothetical protein n=1 Tax=Streptomyces bauhiniae TaxID=2340725 RepID=UPI003656F3E8